MLAGRIWGKLNPLRAQFFQMQKTGERRREEQEQS
jgi:hypothetical protein